MDCGLAWTLFFNFPVITKSFSFPPPPPNKPTTILFPKAIRRRRILEKIFRPVIVRNRRTRGLGLLKDLIATPGPCVFLYEPRVLFRHDQLISRSRPKVGGGGRRTRNDNAYEFVLSTRSTRRLICWLVRSRGGEPTRVLSDTYRQVKVIRGGGNIRVPPPQNDAHKLSYSSVLEKTDTKNYSPESSVR